MNRVTAKLHRLLQRRQLKEALAKTAFALSCVTMFLVTYMLVAPVLTQEWTPLCGLDEHVHTDECYTVELVELSPAPQPDPEPGHTHDDACYTESVTRVLSCGEAEQDGHSHTDDCYDQDGQLLCGEEERPSHRHTDSCYDETVHRELICPLPESQPSAPRQEEPQYEEVRTLICEKEEHTHDDLCYHTVEEKPEPSYRCGFPAEHVHTERCYFESGQLKCTRVEHTHTDACLVPMRPSVPDISEAPTPSVVTPDVSGEPSSSASPGVPETATPSALPSAIPVDLPLDGLLPDLMDALTANSLELTPLAEGDAAFSVIWQLPTSSWTTSGRNNPLRIVYAYTQGSKRVPVSVSGVDDFTVTTRNQNNLDSTSNGQSARAYILANCPKGYSVDHYEVDTSTQTALTVVNASYNPNNSSANPDGWHYQTSSGWSYWTLSSSSAERTLYVIITDSEPTPTPTPTPGADPRGTVQCFVNLVCQTLDESENFEVPQPGSAWTSAIPGDYRVVDGPSYSSDNMSPGVYRSVTGNTGNYSEYYMVDPNELDADGKVLPLSQHYRDICQMATDEGYTANFPVGGESTYHLSALPDNETVMSAIQAEVKNGNKKILSKDGQEIPAAQLDLQNFSVRWFSLKYRGDDYWHLDGVLVRKVARLKVTKTFYGNADAIEEVKSSFSITVRQVRRGTHEEIPDAEARVFTLRLDDPSVVKSVNADGQETYTWTINDVGVSGEYRVTENGYIYHEDDPNGVYATLSEYRFSGEGIENTDETPHDWTHYVTNTGFYLTGIGFDSDSTDYQTIHLRSGYLPKNSVSVNAWSPEESAPLGDVVYHLSRDGVAQKFWLYQDIYYLYQPQLSDEEADKVVETYEAKGSSTGLLTLGGVGKTKDEEGFSAAGNYLLTEVSRPPGYQEAYLAFTVETDGTVHLDQESSSPGITQPEEGNDHTRHVYSFLLPHLLERRIIVFAKTNEDGVRLLEGAQFTLYADKACTKELATAVSDVNGRVNFSERSVGTYYLRETIPPAGYKSAGTSFQIVLTEDALTITAVNANLSALVVAPSQAGGSSLYHIKNEPSQPTPQLPATGGHGPALWYTTGAALCLTAVLLMYETLRPRRKERKGGSA